jgi:hypothetical protein
VGGVITWLRLLRARIWAQGLKREFERLHQLRAGIDAELARNERDCVACAQELAAAQAAHRLRHTSRRFRVSL